MKAINTPHNRAHSGKIDFSFESNFEKKAKLVSDTWLEGMLTLLFSLSAPLKDCNLSARVKQGNVLLEGDVTSRTCLQLLHELCSSVDGIRSIDMQPHIKTSRNHGDTPSPRDISDEVLITRIKSHTLLNTDIDLNRVSINCKDGWVQLSGEVDSEGQRRALQLLAMHENKTRGVSNHLHT